MICKKKMPPLKLIDYIRAEPDDDIWKKWNWFFYCMNIITNKFWSFTNFIIKF